MAERYTTLGQSTLSSGVTDSATSWSVASAASLPAGGNFRLRCDSEIVKVTGVSGTTLTVVRGTEGTTAAAHSSGATVTEVLTAEALDAIRTGIHQTGLYSARPSATAAGGAQANVYHATDIPVGYISDGAAWRGFGPHVTFTKPDAGAFATWTNQGSATLTDVGDCLRMYAPASGANLRMVGKSYTAPYSLIAAVNGYQGSGNHSMLGLFLRDTSSGKVIVFGLNHSEQFVVYRYDNVTTFSSGVYEQTVRFWSPFVWLKIYDDGTTLKFYFSTDGSYWRELATDARSSFLTAPNQAGLVLNSANSHDLVMNVYSVIEGTS